jgi:hypothetical protein
VSLKRALFVAPTLQVPDLEKELVLVTDASEVAASAVLHHRYYFEQAPGIISK